MRAGARAVGVALLGLLGLLGACGEPPVHVVEGARKARLRAVGVERFDTTGAFRLAGVSATRPVEIDPLDVDRLQGDTLGEGYRLVVARCAACHDAPAPQSKPRYLWSGVMTRMRHNAEEAGLLPNTREDEARMLDFLERHAAAGR